MLAEEVLPVAFSGTPDAPVWLDADMVEAVLKLPPAANVPESVARMQANDIVEGLATLRGELDNIAQSRANVLLEAHSRVRQSARVSSRVTVEPVLPVDVLGAFVLLPNNL